MFGTPTQSHRPNTLAEQYLDLARENLPVVDRVLCEHGDNSLFDYVRSLKCGSTPSYQPRDDLFEVLERLTRPLLGASVAGKAARDLAEFPLILTANHHGVNSVSQSFQGSLIFALNALQGAVPTRTICVFSCGNVPMNNSEYPRGLLLYHLYPDRDFSAIKFPIFPDKYKRCMVSATPGFDEGMLKRARGTVARMLQSGRIPAGYGAVLRSLLCEEYGRDSVVHLQSYSEQSVVLNHRIWKKLFKEQVKSPEMVYVEIERVAAELLQQDLLNPNSLAYNIMFDPLLREGVLCDLDGVRGCWELKHLSDGMAPRSSGQRISHGHGTVFFWGIDHSRKRVPLRLREEGVKGLMLCGIDDRGDLFCLPFTPQTLIENMQSGRLLPSLFSCFLTLAFARGVVCVGGYFQAEYLPEMQRRLARALHRSGGYGDAAESVDRVKTDNYLSGMQAVMIKADKDHLISAGPIEILTAGPLGKEDIERMAQVSVRDAHLAGLFDTAPDAIPSRLLPSGWSSQLASECNTLLRDSIVVK